jgi:hypothetical protein
MIYQRDVIIQNVKVEISIISMGDTQFHFLFLGD